MLDIVTKTHDKVDLFVYVMGDDKHYHAIVNAMRHTDEWLVRVFHDGIQLKPSNGSLLIFVRDNTSASQAANAAMEFLMS